MDLSPGLWAQEASTPGLLSIGSRPGSDLTWWHLVGKHGMRVQVMCSELGSGAAPTGLATLMQLFLAHVGKLSGIVTTVTTGTAESWLL
jgi:hypothetical protein